MLGEHIGAGPLSGKNDAGPLRLQVASPKREKIRRGRHLSDGTLRRGLAIKYEYCNI
jgi:hypothetical protein